MTFSHHAAAEDPTVARRWRRWPSGVMNKNRLIDGGLIAWAIIGLLLLGWVVASFIARLSLVFIPLAIALFPAALLAPASEYLKRRGVRPAAAAALVLFAFFVVFGAILTAIGWLIAEELTGVAAAVEAGYADIQGFFEDRFETEIPPIAALLDQLQEWALGSDAETDQTGAVTGAAMTTLELVASFLLGLVALFFYLKDGERIAGWFIALFPPRLRDDVDQISHRVWSTLGAYFRGQLVVAAVDAFFIGLGLFLLDVPLALPLSILIFLGGMFPVVGAFTAGALAVLAINVAVQQLEGNLLAPLIVGRATHLHPLAILVALTAGAVAFGIVGAFLAVPVVASLNAGVRYVVRKDMARPPDPIRAEGATPAPPNTRPDAGVGPGPYPIVQGGQSLDPVEPPNV